MVLPSPYTLLRDKERNMHEGTDVRETSEKQKKMEKTAWSMDIVWSIRGICDRTCQRVGITLMCFSLRTNEQLEDNGLGGSRL